MITRKSLLSIGLIQLGFSALDIYARKNLHASGDLFHTFTSGWFFVWLCLQAMIVPFQIRLITKHGLGRGVVLMNAFSVLYAVIGGSVILQEKITPVQLITTMMVLSAVGLMLTGRKMVATPKYSVAGADQ